MYRGCQSPTVPWCSWTGCRCMQRFTHTDSHTVTSLHETSVCSHQPVTNISQQDWDICVPADQLEVARQIFDDVETFRYSTTTDDDDNLLEGKISFYEQAEPARPTPNSNRHSYPRFKLRGYNFNFVLIPSSDFMPGFQPTRPDGDKAHPNIEYSSQNKIPYPTQKQLARALLFQRNWSDLDDFIDGTNVDVQWGLENLNFEELSKLQAEAGVERGGRVLSAEELESRWRREASRKEKDKRMGEDKMGRWVTRWVRVEGGDGGGKGRKDVESV